MDEHLTLSDLAALSPARPSRASATRWMRAHLEEHRDPRTGEVNHTALTEAWADAHDLADVGGVLDDPDHWCWEAALDAAEAWADTHEDARRQAQIDAYEAA